MTDWLRLWHGAPTDPKWRTVARRSGSRPGDVWAIVAVLMDRASQAPDRGSVEGYDCEIIADALGYDPDEVERVIAALIDKGVIVDGRLASWEKYQPKREDGSAERAKAHRERNRTHANAGERERPIEKSREEEKEEETKADALDAPSASVRPGLFSEAPVYANATDRLWGEGKTTLAAWGVPVKQAGQMIGKWLRDSGDDPPKVLEAIHAAELQRTEDPIPFVTKILQADRSRSHDVRRQDRSSTAAIDRRLAELDAGRFG